MIDANDQPVEAIGAGREEIADFIARHVSGPALRDGNWKAAHRQDQLHAAELILAALSPASPARTPMGGEVEALREAVRLALEDADALERVAEEADDNQWLDWGATMRQAALRIKALAASSPSPAQGGGKADPVEQASGLTFQDAAYQPAEALNILRRLPIAQSLFVWADGSYRVAPTLDLAVARQEEGTIVAAIPITELSASPQPEAGEAVAWLTPGGDVTRSHAYAVEQSANDPANYPKALVLAAPPSVQPVEGK